MKKIFLFASILALFASCTPKSKPTFELEVSINNYDSFKDKSFVITQNIDGYTIYTDTIKIRKDNFQLKVPYLGPALLFISIPQTNVNNLMMAAEEGTILLNIDKEKQFFSGTPLNDRLQAYYLGNDSVSSLFNELSNEFALINDTDKFTPELHNEYREKRRKLLIENTNRIVAFIRENVDNQVGEYYFMIEYINFTHEIKLEMNSFATEKLKREFRMR